ncbi:MAG: hypothetical protein JSV86_06685 [Gemmatimonadota bacterium]|nr:MAG: hypothetical protein JSV86_06685 [Gemmatimonadota bacterium]
MSSQIVWTVSHAASDGTSRGILGMFASREAAVEAGAAETDKWPFVTISDVECDLAESPQPLRGRVWEAKQGGVTQAMMVVPWEVQP